jgi:hypothetical protein
LTTKVAKQNYAHYIAIYVFTNSHLRSAHHASISPAVLERTVSFGKDSISHESIIDKRPSR